MKLPENVKPYPSLFKIIKIFSQKGFNLGTTIYLNKNIYSDLQKDNPKLENIAVLKHEEVHVKRVKEVGTLKFGYKYTFSPKFRLDEELIAYKVMFSFLKEHNASYDLDRVARALSGPRYLWVKPYKEAIKIIEKTWEEA